MHQVKKVSVFKGFRRQTIKSTASKPPVVRRSSASVKKVIFYPGKLRFSGVFLYLLFGYLNLWGLIFEEIDHNMLWSDEN